MRYLKRSVNRHGVHSPFVYTLIEDVFKDKTGHRPELELKRTELHRDRSSIDILDLGAGSSSGAGVERRVCDIARQSLSTSRQCRLLARLLRHMHAKSVLEFGSCLGLSAAYLASTGAQVVSMEGSPAIHNIAKRNFAEDYPSIDFRMGAFDELLPNVLSDMPQIDMAYIDGNHREAPTLDYFKQLLPHIHQDTVLVFDDIHWSEGMERAWDQIRQHERVSLSIDLFWCGMIFFREGLSGEHFTIRY